jgi:hypothetical protein
VTIRFRAEVVTDLAAAHAWYESRRVGLGEEFMAAVGALLTRIDATPEQFPVVYDAVRRGLVRRFPYAVFFCEEDGDRLVLGVVHQAMNPRRWPRQ